MKLWISWEKSIGPMLHLHVIQKHFSFCFCHHDPKRSIHLFGLEKYLCSRCMGILFGSLAGVCLKILQIHISELIAILCIIPLLIDGFTQAFGLRESNNCIRIITGFLCGIGIISFPFPSLELTN